MSYRPAVAPPIADVQALFNYVEQELQEVARAWEAEMVLRVLHVEPTAPREGMLVVADGTDWNPGGGIGVYSYLGAAWVKL